MWPNPKETADLVTFTEEICNGKLHFSCSDQCSPAQSLKEYRSFEISYSNFDLQSNVQLLFIDFSKTKTSPIFALISNGYNTWVISIF